MRGVCTLDWAAARRGDRLAAGYLVALTLAALWLMCSMPAGPPRLAAAPVPVSEGCVVR